MPENTDTVLPWKDRPYDVVLYGVTGFTGRLSARYIVSKYGAPKKGQGKSDNGTQPKISYAFAARSDAKLSQLQQELASEFKDVDVASIPLLKADASRYNTIRDITASTRVIASFVGPYILYGEAVIAACVDTKTHYCDITGEFPWVKRMIEKYGEDAEKSSVKLVPFCGLDSLPSDIGSLLLHEKSIAKYQTSCDEIRVRHLRVLNDFSHGTIETLGTINTCYTEAELSKFNDDYFLCDESSPKPKIETPELGMYKYEDDVGYVSKFGLEFIDKKVVQWSASKLPHIKKPFGFSLGIANFGNAFSASAFYIFTSLFNYLMDIRLTRVLLDKFVLPSPGQGPKKLYNIQFSSKLIGITKDSQGNYHKISGMVSMSEDPGYAGTAKMIVESALMMALDIESCPKTFGILSPALGLGTKIIERLAQCNIFFYIEN